MTTSFVIAFPSTKIHPLSTNFISLKPPRQHFRLPSKYRHVLRMVTEPQMEARTPELSTLKDAGANATAEDTSESSNVGIDPEVVKQKAQEIASDLSSRPGFYVKVLSYVAGGFVALTVFNAVIAAINTIPLLPNLLELVGLAYTAWFIWRYALFAESRTELMEEIDDFIGRTKPKGEVYTVSEEKK